MLIVTITTHACSCDALLQKAKSKQGHSRTALVNGAVIAAAETYAPGSSGSARDVGNSGKGAGSKTEGKTLMCVQCDERSAAVSCVECEKVFCAPCESLLHKAARKKTHVRNAL
jgi:hypothetical protein